MDKIMVWGIGEVVLNFILIRVVYEMFLGKLFLLMLSILCIYFRNFVDFLFYKFYFIK